MHTKLFVFALLSVFLAGCGIDKEVYQANLNELDGAKGEIAKLEETVHEKEEEIKEFSSDLSEKKQQIKNLSSITSDQDSQIEKLSKQKDQAAKEIASINYNLAGLQKIREQLNNSVNTLQANLEESNNANTAKKQEVATLKEKVEGLKNNLIGQEEKTEGILRERTYLIKLDEVNIKEIEGLTKLVLTNNADIKDLQEKISEYDATIKALSEKKNEAIQNAAAVSDKLEGLARERAYLIKSEVISAEMVQEKHKEAANLKGLLFSKNADIKDLQGKISENDATIKDLSEKKNEAMQTAAAVRDKLEGLARERTYLITSEVISAKRVKDKQKEAAKFKGLFLAENADIKDLQEKISGNDATIKALSATKNEAVQTATAVSDKLEGLARERAYLITSEVISAEMVQEKHKETAKLKGLLLAKNADIKDFQEKISENNAIIKVLSEKKNDAVQIAAAISDKLEGLVRERFYLISSDEINAREVKNLTNLILAKNSLIENLSTKVSSNNRNAPLTAIKQELITKELIHELTARISISKASIHKVNAKKDHASPIIQSTYRNFIKTMKDEIGNGKLKIAYAPDRLNVEIGANTLFSSGSAKIKMSGQKVLKKVGDFLKSLKSGEIKVKGHSDNVPIGSRLKKIFPSNWELSIMRAANVVRFLQEKSAIPPKTISGAGYSKYQPIASNDTPEGRAKNRRIEIVILKLG